MAIGGRKHPVGAENSLTSGKLPDREEKDFLGIEGHGWELSQQRIIGECSYLFRAGKEYLRGSFQPPCPREIGSSASETMLVASLAVLECAGTGSRGKHRAGDERVGPTARAESDWAVTSVGDDARSRLDVLELVETTSHGPHNPDDCVFCLSNRLFYIPLPSVG